MITKWLGAFDITWVLLYFGYMIHLICLFLNLSFNLNSHAIFGGEAIPLELGEASFVVRMRPVQSSEGALQCSAVILDSQRLLTAAHCTEELQVFDELKISDPMNAHYYKTRITSVVRHPNYRVGFKANPKLVEVGTDIALINLSHPISFSHSEARLVDEHSYDSSKIYLIANGKAEKSEESPNLALEVHFDISPNVQYPILAYHASQIGGGPCQSDSGGGLFAIFESRPVLIAIQSTKASGTRCGDEKALGFAVPIFENLDWILKAKAKTKQ